MCLVTILHISSLPQATSAPRRSTTLLDATSKMLSRYQTANPKYWPRWPTRFLRWDRGYPVAEPCSHPLRVPAADRDRDLDRTHLSPPPTPAQPWPIDPDRIRNNHDPAAGTRRLTNPVPSARGSPELIITRVLLRQRRCLSGLVAHRLSSQARLHPEPSMSGQTRSTVHLTVAHRRSFRAPQGTRQP